MAYLLGIDIGTSGTKTLICDHTGKVLATAMAEHTIQSPKPGWSEQSPLEWWSATCKATKLVVKKAKIKPTQITGIGLSGQMHGSVFLADDTKPLRPALLWNDQRTQAQCDSITKLAGGKTKLINMVGNPALTGFTAPKILWVRENEPAVYEKTQHILLPKDYIRLCMTGEYATEVGDASGTLLLDVKARKWHKGLISKLDIDPAMLPDCYESHVVTGKLTASAAKAMGLVKDIPVVGGSGDQPAGAVGNGIVQAGIVSATLGTSGVMYAHAAKPVYDKDGRVHTMCSAVENEWCVFGCMLSAGGSFQWFRNNMAAPEMTQAKKKKVDPYTLLIAQAAQATPGCDGLFFQPYLTGERCPYANPNARGGWIGLTARHDRNAMIRSLLEGVTFGMADALNIMQDMGIATQSVRLSGGGARSEFWRQLQADIYNTPVVTINSQEGPAYGVALLAGVGTGVWANVKQACKQAISETEKRKPNRKLAALYQKHHQEYARLYAALEPEYDKIASL
jgi:xylulokinase